MAQTGGYLGGLFKSNRTPDQAAQPTQSLGARVQPQSFGGGEAPRRPAWGQSGGQRPGLRVGQTGATPPGQAGQWQPRPWQQIARQAREDYTPPAQQQVPGYGRPGMMAGGPPAAQLTAPPPQPGLRQMSQDEYMRRAQDLRGRGDVQPVAQPQTLGNVYGGLGPTLAIGAPGAPQPDVFDQMRGGPDQAPPVEAAPQRLGYSRPAVPGYYDPRNPLARL